MSLKKLCSMGICLCIIPLSVLLLYTTWRQISNSVEKQGTKTLTSTKILPKHAFIHQQYVSRNPRLQPFNTVCHNMNIASFKKTKKNEFNKVQWRGTGDHGRGHHDQSIRHGSTYSEYENYPKVPSRKRAQPSVVATFVAAQKDAR